MYQSPIEIIHGELEMQLEGEVYKAVQRVGVNVNKEELLKALQYDRGQYDKGYEDGYDDGYAKAIEEFAEKLCDAISEQYANVEVNGIKFDVLTVDGITEIAWDLADELLKGA